MNDGTRRNCHETAALLAGAQTRNAAAAMRSALHSSEGEYV